MFMVVTITYASFVEFVIINGREKLNSYQYEKMVSYQLSCPRGQAWSCREPKSGERGRDWLRCRRPRQSVGSRNTWAGDKFEYSFKFLFRHQSGYFAVALAGKFKPYSVTNAGAVTQNWES